ncbi:MAG: hypothetical protein Q8O56_17380 [Solirubrobacteraceae bacterium]|nr:hypothetical protein [Solirubrobacteraceae bacterium]
MPAIKAEYGPTLIQLLAPRSLVVRLAAAALAALIVIGGLVIVLTRAEENVVVVREPVTFNFAYGRQFEPVERAGTLVALRNTGAGGLFLDAYTIRPLDLPAYRGRVGGMLPVYADGYLRTLPDRYDDYTFIGEGRARINNAIGYAVTFQALVGERRLYARHYLLVEEEPDGVRRGVVLELESTPAAGTPNADSIGNHGALKMPLRSFRFGTDRKGGTA